MYPVKQSTALDVVFFAFDTNGDAVTGKVDGDFTKRISKNGGAFGAMTVTITERENGWYHAQLSTSHTDTLGILSLTFTASGIKQVNMQFRVHARVLDDLAWPATSGRSLNVSAGGVADADMVAISTDATAADNAESFFDGTGYAGTGNTIPTVTSVTNIVTANTTQISGDSVAADNCEAFFDGTGYAGTGNVIPSVTTVTGNVNGSVASVTGAVGSVAGNVDGNVTGSIGSLGATAKTDVNAEVDTAIADANLDHLVGTATGIPAIVAGTYLDQITRQAAGTFNRETDSLEAIRNQGDSAWITATTVTTVTGNVDGNVAGSVGSVTGNVGGNVTGSVGSLATQAKADVNAEVVDCLITDTYAEAGSVPAATSSIKDKLNWLFLLGRNKRTRTSAGAAAVRNDADSADVATATVSDDGTTFTFTEWA